MNTYETMKHNIPEGATHYHNESEDHFFCWFKMVDGEWFAFCPEEKIEGWTKTIDEHKRDGFSKIPTEPTYRYEKVTDSIFDLKEEFERGELFEMVGVEIYRKVKKERYLAESFFHETLYRRIEVTERELELEAAYDLYCDYTNANTVDATCMGRSEFSSSHIALKWLSIVRKTGYRKDFNLVNGKG